MEESTMYIPNLSLNLEKCTMHCDKRANSADPDQTGLAYLLRPKICLSIQVK